MKKLFLSLFIAALSFTAFAQDIAKSKIYMKNGDMITARIVGYKPQQAFTVEISTNVIVDLPFKDIQSIVIDASNAPAQVPNDNSNSLWNKPEKKKKDKATCATTVDSQLRVLPC